MTKCVFCPEKADTIHHIIPKAVRKLVGWNGKRAEKYMLKKSVPMCRKHHNIFNVLVEPIIFVLESFRPQPEVPMELSFMIEAIMEKLGDKEDE